MKTLILIFTVVAMVAVGFTSLPAIALAGNGTWNEQGDAGDLPGTAQETTGPPGQSLTTIDGSLSSATDVDMYCIHIDGNYSASLCAGTGFDSQLWLFETDGTGLRFRDDACGLQSTLGEFQPGPGDYLLAVSGYDKDALNSLGLEIWMDEDFTTERAPDGPGMLMPEVASWGTNTGASGDYVITLTGVSYCDASVPVQPTTWGSIKATYRN